MQRLENLEVTKVAFVPEGDNKKADVLLFKSKPDPSEAGQGEKKPEVVVTEKEAGVMKRVLLALGKAFGFSDEEGAESHGAEPAKKTAPDNSAGKPGEKKGVDAEMKIDKSKLTPEELAQLEAIEKKAGVQEDTAAADGVEKKAEDPAGASGAPAADTQKAAAAPAAAAQDGEDIYKGLHPAVASELKALRKRADEAEERELTEVAKKYELLGKKPEELAKTLKTLKAAGGSAYDDMIGVLDASLATVEKSGAFSEVGKSGGGQPEPWDQIEKHADDILKAAPTMTRAQALEKACELHPELVAQYEQEREGGRE